MGGGAAEHADRDAGGAAEHTPPTAQVAQQAAHVDVQVPEPRGSPKWEYHPDVIASGITKRGLWRWLPECRYCGATANLEYGGPGPIDKPPGWNSRLDLCPTCMLAAGHRQPAQATEPPPPSPGPQPAQTEAPPPPPPGPQPAQTQAPPPPPPPERQPPQPTTPALCIQDAEPVAGGAAEHASPGASILLDARELATIRTAERLPKKQLHDQARKALNEFANAEYAGPVSLEDLFPWKRYLALHDEGEKLVGPGINRATLDQFPEVRDPNRQGRPRSDFIFERVDGSAYRVHPGSKPQSDAKLVYCPPGRAPEQTGVCYWLFPGTCFTFEDACRVPQTDKLGKEEVFRTLQNNPDNLQWWRFAANLGAHTQRVIGDGIFEATLQVFNDKLANIRLQRRDGSTVDVELRYTPRRGVQTHVHP